MTAVSHITTHVLDAVQGLPAPGVAVQLTALRDGEWQSVADAVTDQDGRAKQLGPERLPAGTYRLRFDTGAYFAARGIPTFYPEALLTFVVDDEERHYHVPLLLSPFAYSTYRGS
ncbi:hydroxyisourate hydrolase [Microbacterium resistens]|uniref:5-hydroxyisourate hydrolase n=1 Tax=Microbacterium resistens TaxID=156977 RepID=A0ABY3RRE6_9MICO|nr:hydroxyisourate hydrolase [Microbacterium resistens]MBW1640516.1 hydroxyisourate hydrolase [Microbacterium resistens]MDA4895596.1 hydroxyisourate hydrolase [Streptomyces sp. MS2A]UGS26534.1 hydroxyisourate hydrolase [Microbacterium resistens]